MKQIRHLSDPAFCEALKKSQKIFICTHIHPDGDAVGSLLAMRALLLRMQKEVTACIDDPVPEIFGCLPGVESILQPDQIQDEVFDTAIALDCADAGRMGRAGETFEKAGIRLQLDHHATNPRYADVNEVDGDASCTGCMVWRMMGDMNLDMDRETAECLYAAVSSDTGNFCFPCTDEETFLCAADVASAGIDIHEIAREIHLLQSVAHVRLLGRALASLALFDDGQCASMILDHSDFEEARALPEHTDGIVNYGLNLYGVKMAFLIDASEEDKKKVSFRAIMPYDVSGIARELGGGGHRLAAGCLTDKPIDELVHFIEDAMIEQIKEKA